MNIVIKLLFSRLPIQQRDAKISFVSLAIFMFTQLFFSIFLEVVIISGHTNTAIILQFSVSGVSWNIFTMFLGITLCFGESVGRVKIQGTRTEMTEMALKMIARLTIIFGFYENPTTEQNAMKRKKLPLITSIKELLVNGLETWYIFLCHASFWRARAVGELKYKGGDALFAICDVYNKRQTSLLEHKYQYVRNLSFKCYFYSTE